MIGNNVFQGGYCSKNTYNIGNLLNFMIIIKSFFIFFATLLVPVLGIILVSDGALRVTLILMLVLFWLIVLYFAEKLILLAFGAREIIDADNQLLFQALKGQTYRYHEKPPRVYLYTGHRLKCFVLEKFGGWSILLDRNLIKGLGKEQTEALVSYIILYKKSARGRVQTLGMGVLSVILKIIYGFWSLFKIGTFLKIRNIGIFISLIMVKPLIELILFLSKVNSKIECPYPLKSVYYQIDDEVIHRSFINFMTYHLYQDVAVQDLIVEFLEEYPMLENCKFEGT